MKLAYTSLDQQEYWKEIVPTSALSATFKNIVYFYVYWSILFFDNLLK